MDHRRCVKGRRLFFAKHKVVTIRRAPPAVTDLPECREIEESFRRCAYPNEVEILRLAEELDLTQSRIKIEFKKRREDYRQRKKLSKDTLVHSSWQHRLNAVVTSLQKAHSMNRGLIKSAIVGFALASLWYSQYLNRGGCTYSQLMT